ncbi:GatB/YqeY domain-containing protein [Leptospira gomenensis]|uniref:GatB/YqeY domain-containing protein n=1 Tax=Leptospira gomenensis TaxID=2484974 RepID=A0A5F1Z3T0_9LEPT|nr:GatB/YqeY domain-containing protein [Leptospira gomenensis]TGK35083.1 GatB/YqeY domain-containing protein [Leptospira gomenensis]TGK35239.1 GatB/YqeY domain-containing protein [Leptospira gomenensis]TGK41100.1 GatB/YqeY domain-containing protein [Leptospira gomenensis]TGK67628.1 GatB/YqeY domain-containing protein [Leptospira gomenensis]
MSLQIKINDDLKEAMKAKKEPHLSTLRLLKSDIQYELTKTGAKELSDEQVITVVKKAYAKRMDAIEMYQKAGRNDLLEQEQGEAGVLKEYLPPELPEEEIIATIDRIFAELQQPTAKDMGKVMGKVMAAFKGKSIDGTKVSAIVKSRLS